MHWNQNINSRIDRKRSLYYPVIENQKSQEVFEQEEEHNYPDEASIGYQNFSHAKSSDVIQNGVKHWPIVNSLNCVHRSRPTES